MRALEQTPGRRRRRPGRARFNLLLSELRVQKVANEEFKEGQLETLEKRRSGTAQTESLQSANWKRNRNDVRELREQRV